MLAKFNTKPDYGQFARDGNWESAVAFRPGEFCELEQAQEYIGNGTEVACEVFFGQAFFGLRRNGDPNTLAGFIVDFARAVANSNQGDELIELIAQRENLELARNFRCAEIGAVNAWKSVGPFTVPDPGLMLNSFDLEWERLKKYPVFSNNTHPKALEFAFNNSDGTTHWFAYPISFVDPPWEIDAESLRGALSAFSAA